MTNKTVARPFTSAKTAAAPKRTRSIVLGDPDLEVLHVDLVRPDGRVLRVRLDVEPERVDLEVDHAEGEKHFRAYDTLTEWSGPPRATLEEAEKDAEEHNEGCARQGVYGSAVVAERDEGDRLWNAYTGETLWPPHGRSNGAAATWNSTRLPRRSCFGASGSAKPAFRQAKAWPRAKQCPPPGPPRPRNFVASPKAASP